MSSSVETAAGTQALDAYLPDLPAIELPQAPAAALLWKRGLTVAGILITLFTLDVITIIFADYWLFQSLGLTSVFWTNFVMGAELYVSAFIVFAAGIAVPAYTHDVSPRMRRAFAQTAFLVASVAAYLAATNYSDFLLGGKGFTFDQTDPVFHLDIGFYAFNLPNLWIAWKYLTWGAAFFLLASVFCANAARARNPAALPLSRLRARVALSATPTTQLAWVLLGILTAIGVWLTRYDLLLRNNSDAATIKRGAQYLDVVGFFSNLNYIWLTAFIVLGITAAVWLLLRAIHEPSSPDWRDRVRRFGRLVIWLVVLDFGFKCVVVARYWVFVKPNEPVIQMPYIQRHVDATRAAYNLDGVQEVDFLPNRPGDPVPSADSLLASPTLKNAPLWPGFVSYLERWIDRQHSQRILQTQGSAMVYGPTLELFQQQQKLRTYYNFINVDSVRYTVNGEKKMFVSAVRETPLYEPVPWLAYWGQRFMMFTHGWGLVAAPAAEITGDGGPAYVSWDIPSKVKYPELKVDEQRVYYGE
ncbi:MAG TPA: UPF0182 family protein, partial [Thermoanaerobaculia bacterium]